MTHTDFEQLAAGFVLGALEPDDESAFQRHLEGCSTCEASVRELEAVVGKLAYSATPVEPPPSLRASIRREVAATARPRGARATGAAAAREMPRHRRRWTTTVVGRLAVAASVIVLLALGFWNLSLRDQNDRYQQRIAAFEQAGRLLNDPAAQTIRLEGSAGKATALVSSPQDKGFLVVGGGAGALRARHHPYDELRRHRGARAGGQPQPDQQPGPEGVADDASLSRWMYGGDYGGISPPE